MSALLIKNLPPELHQDIKDLARLHHRSLMQEALTLLEEAVHLKKKKTPPKPYQGSIFITDEWLDQARREGRE